jgi:hypothetical protein
MKDLCTRYPVKFHGNVWEHDVLILKGLCADIMFYVIC